MKIDFSVLIATDLDTVKISELEIFFQAKHSTVNYGQLCFDRNGDLSKQQETIYRACLEHILERVKLGLRPETAKAKIESLKLFSQYLTHHTTENYDSPEFICNSILSYRRHLVEKIRSNKLKPNSAATYFRDVRSIFLEVFKSPYRDAIQRIPVIAKVNSRVEHVEPPTEDEVKRYLNLTHELFFQVTEHLLKEKTFPIKVIFEGKVYWGLPSLHGSWSSYSTHKKVTKPNLRAYDETTGKPLPLEKITEIYTKKPKPGDIKRIHERLCRPYRDAGDPMAKRANLRHAKYAKLAFLGMFFASTGMNFTTAARLQWSDEFSISTSKAGFKAIKYRAGGNVVEFQIASNFVKLFKRYLKLRDYIIKTAEIDPPSTLFFSTDRSGNARQLDSITSGRINNYLRDNFGFDISITSKHWRVNKTQWYLENYGLFNAADAMQNSPRTLLKHYTQGNKQQAYEELKSFHKEYKSSLVLKADENGTELVHGVCREISNPVPISSDSEFRIDCVDLQGCLFCKKFAIKTDQMALRKLLSYRYVLKQLSITELVAKNVSSTSISPVLEIIDNLIEAITSSGQISEALFPQIFHDVEKDENLTDYWRERYELLIDLGAI